MPTTGNPRLSLRVANHPGGTWKLEVRVAGQTLLDQAIDQNFTAGGWKDLEVDLKSFAGQNVWLDVRQVEAGPAPYAKWKRLDIVQ